ncbi:Oxo-4-hydroxy-4-carboxy-5-ureidoimidazoline decarboxylase [Talaromyces proteolyticus]|uniref:Oxo-4-hydroxy-4-carboxy-5-ureidoimidazoline decarboxylase n=1 Tax=Talaromyces proteolyticus TaxID=1131652 RepID=A0AAD4PXA8_9EURO|nr:Oxo-4-hydroxy-4-carboxy-5-ureidoimidazoline decarboxylase [Talaromyces proteolyticus]KAH8696199.1 Oxo-4-hydroxy-4-carboxy-5-ureidoimidazoline decarboxylase [Talaromyces proteolyticus]
MSTPTIPPITSLSTLPADAQLRALDTLFEPSPELHALVQPILSKQTFPTYDALIDEIQTQLSTLSAKRDNALAEKETLYAILGSHPRLGIPSPAAQAHLSELSRREQANLNSHDDSSNSAELAARLDALNREYEEMYPGLRYVTFVNGRGRDVIMVDMRSRIDRANLALEVQDNIQAMCDIAKDRAGKLQ